MKVASVLRTNPLRVQLTVPEQHSAEVAVGRSVSFEVDASPGQKFTGQVRMSRLRSKQLAHARRRSRGAQ